MGPRELWAIYFANLVAMQYHPGFCRGDLQRLTLEECATIADDMIDKTWSHQCQHGSQQAPQS